MGQVFAESDPMHLLAGGRDLDSFGLSGVVEKWRITFGAKARLAGRIQIYQCEEQMLRFLHAGPSWWI
jgi:hypothetical protein